MTRPLGGWRALQDFGGRGTVKPLYAWRSPLRCGSRWNAAGMVNSDGFGRAGGLRVAGLLYEVSGEPVGSAASTRSAAGGNSKPRRRYSLTGMRRMPGMGIATLSLPACLIRQIVVRLRPVRRENSAGEWCRLAVKYLRLPIVPDRC